MEAKQEAEDFAFCPKRKQSKREWTARLKADFASSRSSCGVFWAVEGADDGTRYLLGGLDT